MTAQKPARRIALGSDPLDGLIPQIGPQGRAPEATPRPIDVDTRREESAVIAADVAPTQLPAHEPPVVTSTPVPAPAVAQEPKPVSVKARGPKKVRATFHISEALFDGVRDAVVQLSGPPLRLNLGQFAENALRRELERLKAEHNSGDAFPRREGELRGGRPVGS